MPSVKVNGKEYLVPAGSRLDELLVAAALAMPCGGNGICGRCRVTVEGAVGEVTAAEQEFLTADELAAHVRLACYTTIEGDCTVTTDAPEYMSICTALEKDIVVDTHAVLRYGAAVDIGTTTLAVTICDNLGRQLAVAATPNPQISWGADVLSRAEAVVRHHPAVLTECVQTTIARLLMDATQTIGLSTTTIDGVVITGNTAMLCMLTATPVETMICAPFVSRRLFGEMLTASDCGLHCLEKETPVYLPRCSGAFLGADLTCAILYSGLCEEMHTALLVDVGTNGEMALWHKGELYLCSTAAGPAFEGVGISCGLPAVDGAIDRVEIVNGQLFVHTIAAKQARGICGSGVLDAVACLRDLGEMDIYGHLDGTEYIFADGVALTQEDVYTFLTAKSAIYSGLMTLLHVAGATVEQVERLYLAGGFGSALNAKRAGRVGLFPMMLTDRVETIGNAALGGAVSVLMDPHREQALLSLLQKAHQVDLASNPYFADAFVRNMMFPY